MVILVVIELAYGRICVQRLDNQFEQCIRNTTQEYSVVETCYTKLVESYVACFFKHNKKVKTLERCLRMYKKCSNRTEMAFPCKNAYSKCHYDALPFKVGAMSTGNPCKKTCDVDQLFCIEQSKTIFQYELCTRARMMCSESSHCYRTK